MTTNENFCLQFFLMIEFGCSFTNFCFVFYGPLSLIFFMIEEKINIFITYYVSNNTKLKRFETQTNFVI